MISHCRSETGSRKSFTGGRRSSTGSRRGSASGEPAPLPLGPAALALQRHLEAGPPQLRFGGLLGYLEEAGSRIVPVGGACATLPAVAVATEAENGASAAQQQASQMGEAGAQQVADQLQALDTSAEGAAAPSAEPPTSSPEDLIWSQLIGALGSPHNFDPPPAKPQQPDTVPTAASSTSEVPTPHSTASGADQPGMAMTEEPHADASSPDQARQAPRADPAIWEQYSTAALRFQSEPLRRMLMQDLAPELTAVLLEVAASRPADPIKLIAERLIKVSS